MGFRQKMKDGKTIMFPMEQWLPNADASSNALVRWCNDKPLWDEESYKQAGATPPKPWAGALHLKDSYEEEAVAYECSSPGMAGYKKAFPICSFTTVEEGIDDKGVATTSESQFEWKIPFNSKNKFAISVHLQNNNKDENAILLMKGGSDVVLKRCDYVMHRGERVALTESMRARYEELNLVLAKLGRRVLSSAELVVTPEMVGCTGKTGSWEGFNCDSDVANFPLGTEASVLEARVAAKRAACAEARTPVPGAIDKCHSAGILVVMVTGDHPATAEAIAKEIGIIKSKGGAPYSDRVIQNKR